MIHKLQDEINFSLTKSLVLKDAKLRSEKKKKKRKKKKMQTDCLIAETRPAK